MAIGNIIKGVMAAKGGAGRRGGGVGRGLGVGATKGGTRGGRAGGTSTDAAVGRGVRSLLRRAR